PTWFDFLCLLAGFGVSLVLTEWSGFAAKETEQTPPWVRDHALRVLPALLFAPVGPLLLWPLFFLTQRVRGRTEAMSSGEWPWGVAWLAVLPWVAGVGWQHWDPSAAEALAPAAVKRWLFVGYAIGTLSLGALAGLLAVLGLLGRGRPPWTHSLCLALLLWP